jgi:hypothetical protein
MFLPEGYDEFVLCNEIYHCTPTELAEQPVIIVRRDLAIWQGIQQVRRYKQQHAANQQK